MKKTIGKFLMLTALAGTISSGFAAEHGFKPEDVADPSKHKVLADYGVNIHTFKAIEFIPQNEEKTTTVAKTIVDFQSKNAVSDMIQCVTNDLDEAGGKLITALMATQFPEDAARGMVEGSKEEGVLNSEPFNDLVMSYKEQLSNLDPTNDKDEFDGLIDAYASFRDSLSAVFFLNIVKNNITVEDAFKGYNEIANRVYQLSLKDQDKLGTANAQQLMATKEHHRVKAEQLTAENANLKQRITELEAASSQNNAPRRGLNRELSAQKPTVSNISSTSNVADKYAKYGNKKVEIPQPESNREKSEQKTIVETKKQEQPRSNVADKYAKYGSKKVEITQQDVKREQSTIVGTQKQEQSRPNFADKYEKYTTKKAN